MENCANLLTPTLLTMTNRSPAPKPEINENYRQNPQTTDTWDIKDNSITVDCWCLYKSMLKKYHRLRKHTKWMR